MLSRFHPACASVSILAFLLVFSTNLSAVDRAFGDTIYVSPQGDDSESGDRDHPLKTISAAAEKAMPGDTVLVLAGTYRERVAPPRSGGPGKPIVFKGEPGKRVFIKGSEIWQPQWRQDGGGVYSAVPAAELFDGRSPEYLDSHNPLFVQLASTPWERDGKKEVDRGFGGDPNLTYTCGQVFLNGKRLKEVPYRDEVATGHWFFDKKENRVYVGFGKRQPSKQQIELTTRRRIFAPKKRGLGYITVEGFIMEHCGNQYPTNFWSEDANGQKGALGTEAGHHWIIRRNVVRLAKTFAIDAGYVDRHTKSYPVNDNLIEDNYILDNGSAGILSNKSENLVIRGNVVLNNNTLRFFELKRWEQAGIKCHNLSNGHIHHNYVADNIKTYGIWLDNRFPDSRVSHNVIVNNGRAGVFLEMSDYGFDKLLVDHNLIVGNGENAAYIHDASGSTFTHNLMAGTKPRGDRGQAVYIRQVSARTKTYHHSFYNNLFIDNHHLVNVNYPSHRSGPQRFNHNVYEASASDLLFSINRMSDVPSPWTDEEFLDLVLDEIGEQDSAASAQQESRGIKLTVAQWRSFWQNHRLKNDTASVLHSGSEVEYDDQRQRLILNIAYDPQDVVSTPVEGLDRDYFGNRLLQNGQDRAGPFQNLQRGRNEFNVWSGLPIVQPGQLPDADVWKLEPQS